MALVLAVFLSLVFGCGYHIAGKGGGMPGNITELAVPIFKNNTRKPDIETLVTSAFATEFLTTVKVVDTAGAVMQGVIKSYELNAVSFTRSDVNQEYRLRVAISVRIVMEEDGRVLWSDDNITDYEDFIVDTSDVTATEEAEIAALKKLARDTARLVKERMLDDF
jgi:outer membrane lipopolysaccharide assembly protein LptE/RlpB